MTLPDVAQRKLQQLSQQASDAMALRDAAKRQVGDAESRAHVLINNRADEADVERAITTVEAAKDLLMDRHHKYEEAEQLCTRLQSWVRELPRGTKLETVPAPSITTNGTPAVAIAEIRAKIAALAAEFHHVKLAPPPLDDGKRQVRELVARLGAKGAPKVTNQSGVVSVYGWDNPQQIFGPTFHDTTVATLCWLMPDTVIARLDEALEAMPHTPDALPLAQRAPRLAEIEAEIELLEGREESLIEWAHQDGVVIERRHDQSPSSVLGVRIVTSVKRKLVAA